MGNYKNAGIVQKPGHKMSRLYADASVGFCEERQIFNQHIVRGKNSFRLPGAAEWRDARDNLSSVVVTAAQQKVSAKIGPIYWDGRKHSDRSGSPRPSAGSPGLREVRLSCSQRRLSRWDDHQCRPAIPPRRNGLLGELQKPLLDRQAAHPRLCFQYGFSFRREFYRQRYGLSFPLSFSLMGVT